MLNQKIIKNDRIKESKKICNDSIIRLKYIYNKDIGQFDTD